MRSQQAVKLFNVLADLEWIARAEDDYHIIGDEPERAPHKRNVREFCLSVSPYVHAR